MAPSAEAQTVGGITLSTASAAAITQTNLLSGGEEPNGTMTMGGGDGAKYYKLTYNKNGDEKVLGWYWGASDGAAFTSAAHKAWLALPASMPAPARGYFGLPGDGETTGIGHTETTESTEIAGVWYTLDGRKLNGKPTAKGVYIVNGKKVVIK